MDGNRFGCVAILAMGVAAVALPVPRAWSQSGGTESATDAEAAPAGEEDSALLGEEELDELVAPVALFPDSLLAQIAVAATYPLDVMKADRFVEDSADLSDAERMNAAEQQDWDPSIQVLAGGFPDVVSRMADEIDWTETFGEAVLAQTDDVLAAVQRQRARAHEFGNLESNEAQQVEVEDGEISIAPADPEIVYVPSYDSSMAFAQPVTTAPVVDGYSGTDMIMAGAMSFGAAMLVNEIFDDDDDDWDDYWRHGPGYPPPIHWGDGDGGIYPRPGIDVDGDVNIDIDRGNIGDRVGKIDRDEIDLGDRDGKWKPDEDRRNEAQAALRDRKGGDHPREGAGSGMALGQGGGRDGARDDLKRRIEAGGNGDGQARQAAAARRNAPAAARPALPSGGAKPKIAAAHPKKISKPARGGVKPKLSRPAGPKKSASAFQRKSSGSKARKASNRGRASAGNRGRRR